MALKKYPPTVAFLINRLQAGLGLYESASILKANSASVTLGRVYWSGNVKVSSQAWALVCKTANDLLFFEHYGLGVKATLTERGKNIKLRVDGQEMPVDWVFVPKRPRWPGCKAFVCTDGSGWCKVFEDPDTCDAWWAVGKGDPAPWMQIAGPDLRGIRSKSIRKHKIDRWVAENRHKYNKIELCDRT